MFWCQFSCLPFLDFDRTEINGLGHKALQVTYFIATFFYSFTVELLYLSSLYLQYWFLLFILLHSFLNSWNLCLSLSFLDCLSISFPPLSVNSTLPSIHPSLLAIFLLPSLLLSLQTPLPTFLLTFLPSFLPTFLTNL